MCPSTARNGLSQALSLQPAARDWGTGPQTPLGTTSELSPGRGWVCKRLGQQHTPHPAKPCQALSGPGNARQARREDTGIQQSHCTVSKAATLRLWPVGIHKGKTPVCCAQTVPGRLSCQQKF